MITCPKCNSAEMEGALFCSTCGTSLIGQVSVGEPGGAESSKSIVLEFIDIGQELKLSGKQKYVLGRSVPSKGNHRLDADLNLYGGYETGVSRQHAMLKVEGMHVIVLDLNSSNRTFIDGEELFPGNEYEMQTDSVLRLGKLRIKVRLAD